MTEFITEAEVLKKTKRYKANNVLAEKYRELWDTEDQFIRELVEHENEFAQFPTKYTAYQSAYTTARSIRNRERARFRESVNGLPGSFKAVVVEEDDRLVVYVAYTTKRIKGTDKKRKKRH